MKKLFLSFLIIFLLYSCYNDDTYSSITKNECKLEHVNSRILQNNLKHTAFDNALTNFKNALLTPSSNARLIYNSNYGFYIDEESGMYLEEENYHSYTYFVYDDKDQENKIKNILFSYRGNDVYDVLLVEYDLTNDDLMHFTKDEIKRRDNNFFYLGSSGPGNTVNIVAPELMCIDFIELVELEYPAFEGDLVGGAVGYDYEWVVQGNFLFYVWRWRWRWRFWWYAR